MPTKHKRHSITEVGPVKEALELVRSEFGVERVDLPELVALGAERKVELKHEQELAEERRRALRERLIARTTRPEAVDLEAAIEVRESGFARDFDE